VVGQSLGGYSIIIELTSHELTNISQIGSNITMETSIRKTSLSVCFNIFIFIIIPQYS
jgi:hypothetical protein